MPGFDAQRLCPYLRCPHDLPEGHKIADHPRYENRDTQSRAIAIGEENERLRNAVIEKAKAWYYDGRAPLIVDTLVLQKAIQALLDFESQHNVGK